MKTSNKTARILDPVTVKEAARLAGITPQRIGRLAQVGRIDGVRDNGGYWVLSLASVREFCRTRALEVKLEAIKSATDLSDPISVREAARIIGTGRQQVHNMITAKRFRAALVGGFWFVEREDAVKYRADRSGSR